MTIPGFTNTELQFLQSSLSLLVWMQRHDAVIAANPSLSHDRQTILDPAVTGLVDGWRALKARLEDLLGGTAIPAAPGAPGTRVFMFETPASVWTATHNLQARPAATVTDLVGNVIDGRESYPNLNQMVVSFSRPETGMIVI